MEDNQTMSKNSQASKWTRFLDWTKRFEGLVVVITAMSLVITSIVDLTSMAQQTKAQKAQEAAIRANTYEDMVEKMGRIHEAFLTYPELRQVFYEKNVTADTLHLDEDSITRVDILTEWLADFFDNVHRQRATMPEENTYKEWQSYIVDIYCRSATLHEFLDEECKWYGDLRAMLTDALKEKPVCDCEAPKRDCKE